MNFTAVIAGLNFAWQHKKDIADACEAAIHVVRRIEALSHKHNVTVDKVLTTADEGLHLVNGTPPAEK